jgi:hypothetical protein
VYLFKCDIAGKDKMESADEYPKMRGLSTGCGAAPPSPPPAKPSVSLSSESETGECNADEVCCVSSSVQRVQYQGAWERVTWVGKCDV